MPSERGRLLGPLFGGSRADQEPTDRAFLQAMPDAERALAAHRPRLAAAGRAGGVATAGPPGL